MFPFFNTAFLREHGRNVPLADDDHVRRLKTVRDVGWWTRRGPFRRRYNPDGFLAEADVIFRVLRPANRNSCSNSRSRPSVSRRGTCVPSMRIISIMLLSPVRHVRRVAEGLASNETFHIMRDHPYHITCFSSKVGATHFDLSFIQLSDI